MTVKEWAWIAFGAGSVAALAILARYAQTSIGDNPYTLEGAFNVLRLERYFRRAVDLVGGKVNSGWRSEAVNQELAARGYNPAKNSDHMHGRAIDIAPGVPLPTATLAIVQAARAGTLGPVRQIIQETAKGIVHVGWHQVGAPEGFEILEMPTMANNYRTLQVG